MTFSSLYSLSNLLIYLCTLLLHCVIFISLRIRLLVEIHEPNMNGRDSYKQSSYCTAHNITHKYKHKEQHLAHSTLIELYPRRLLLQVVLSSVLANGRAVTSALANIAAVRISLHNILLPTQDLACSQQHQHAKSNNYSALVIIVSPVSSGA